MANRNPRPRLKMGQARGLLLDAAREVFDARGYRGARTREIADRAGVSEALLYRHFASKAKLFEVAVLEPVNEFFEGFVERWGESLEPTDQPFEDTVREFVEGLYGPTVEARASILALLASSVFESAGGANGEPAFPPLFARAVEDLDDVAVLEWQRRHFDHPNPVVATRVSTALVVAMALLDEFLFGPPAKAGLTREDLTSEMVQMIAVGIGCRRGPGGGFRSQYDGRSGG